MRAVLTIKKVGREMKTLILSIAIFTLLACSNVTNSGGDEYGDTLFVVSDYPIRYMLLRGGDSIGGWSYAISQRELDSNNGIWYEKIPNNSGNAEWMVSIAPEGLGGGYSNTLIVDKAPTDKAYYFDMSNSTWQTMNLDKIIEAVNYKEEIWK
jgi:hypothetical protein